MADDLTPAMRQYKQVKKEHPTSIVLFRMGDFYEMFFDDAKEASKILEIVLTARAGVPMCGVPYHAVDMYLKRLLAVGKHVAICEQIEDPKLAKGIVKRGIIRIVTPGTAVHHFCLLLI